MRFFGFEKPKKPPLSHSPDLKEINMVTRVANKSLTDGDYSIVRDWNMAQGLSHSSDEIGWSRRDLNLRHVTIENSGLDSIGVAITVYYGSPIPGIQFVLQGGETRDLGINTVDGPIQYIYILDPRTSKLLGTPYPMRHDAQSFVLRDGIQKWYVHAFKKAYPYRGS